MKNRRLVVAGYFTMRIGSLKESTGLRGARLVRKIDRLTHDRLIEARYRLRRWSDRRRRSRWAETKLPFDWDAEPHNRISLLNRIAVLIGARSYLEIGCDDNVAFYGVACEHKVGVDPLRGGTHRMTSDEFFRLNAETFALVFVDGLHQHRQALADVENALAALAPGGVIVVHDCLPSTYAEQAVPRQQETWTGDVWKAMFDLKSRSDVDIRVAAIDHGCGIVLPRPRTDTFEGVTRGSLDMGFDFFVHHWQNLGIVDYESAIEWVGNYARSVPS